MNALLFASLLALGAGQDTAIAARVPRVRLLADAAAHVALVRVEQLAVEGAAGADSLVWALCTVERPALGPERALWVLAGCGERPAELAVGERRLLFLGLADGLSCTAAGEGTRLFRPLSGGRLEVRDDGAVRLGPEMLPLPAEVEPLPGGRTVAAAALLDWLDARYEELGPRLEVRVRTSGPLASEYVLDAAGRYRWQRSPYVDEVETGEVEPAALRALWRTVEGQRFFTLPRRLSRDRRREGESWSLELRHPRYGEHQVSLGSLALLRVPRIEWSEEAARALDVYLAIPGGPLHERR